MPPSMPLTPQSVFTSTCDRMNVVPWETASIACRRDCRAGSIGKVFRTARSFSILSIRRSPTSLRYHGRPRSDLFRWVCASTRPGRDSFRFPSSTGTPAVGETIPTAAICPPGSEYQSVRRHRAEHWKQAGRRPWIAAFDRIGKSGTAIRRMANRPAPLLAILPCHSSVSSFSLLTLISTGR